MREIDFEKSSNVNDLTAFEEKQGGRPPKDPKKLKNKRVCCYFNQKDYEKLEKLSEKEDITPAKYLEMLLKKAN